MGAAIQLNRRNRGIKLAGQFDLINGGMPCKTLFVSRAYFRNPKAFGQRSQDISAAVSAVSRIIKKNIPGLGAHRGRKGRAESGSSIYNAVRKLRDGDNMQPLFGTYYGP